MALGATPRDIARLLLGETGVLLAIGAVCGIGLALAGGRAASALLFRVRRTIRSRSPPRSGCWR